MVELATKDVLDGLDRTIGAVRLVAIGGRALVSVAFGAAMREQLSSRVAERLDGTLPAIGRCSGSDVRLIGLQQDQVWCAFKQPDEAADDALATRLGENHGARLTDQSDGWVQVRIEGTDTIPVLERLCPLDLCEQAMPIDSCARTVMEHLGTIIVRVGVEEFELLTARSSAQSFVNALENAAGHVAAERTMKSGTGH